MRGTRRREGKETRGQKVSQKKKQQQASVSGGQTVCKLMEIREYLTQNGFSAFVFAFVFLMIHAYKTQIPLYLTLNHSYSHLLFEKLIEIACYLAV